MKKPVFYVLIFLLFVTHLGAQITLILQPDAAKGKDAFVDQLSPATNFGTHLDIISYDWTFSGDPGLGHSMLQFDLSAVPPNSQIVSAQLSLFHNSITGSGGQAGNNACYLKKITSPWAENTVTWNTAPSTTLADSIYLAKSNSANQNYPNIDFTKLVQYWYLNPSANYGVMLELINPVLYTSMKFCSSDVTDSLKRPKLTITYNTLTGFEEIDKNTWHVLIYPHPMHDKVTVELPAGSEKYTFSMYDMNGRQLLKQDLNTMTTQIDVSSIEGGVYCVKIENGQTIFRRRMIKK